MNEYMMVLMVRERENFTTQN